MTEKNIIADANRGLAFLVEGDHVATARGIVSWQCGITDAGTAVLIDNQRVLTQNIASALAAVEQATLKRIANQAARECERIAATTGQLLDQAADRQAD